MTRDLPSATELARFSLAQQHPLTREWANEEVRLAELTDDHNEDVLLATDLEIATIRRDRFAPGRPIELLLNRWVAATPDLDVMISMRYEGGDPGLPFVDASVLSRAVTAADLAPLADVSRACFGTLGPTYLRVWSAEPRNAFPDVLPDKRFLAAPLRDLRSPSVPEGLQLHRATGLAHYVEARSAYAAVDASFPEHPRQASLADQAKLAAALDAGLLFDVLADDQWIGYVAAKAEGKLGLPGFTIQELVLTENGRGNGRGRYLSTLLARGLPGDEDVLVGTVHQNNAAAQRAARAAGRHDIGGWFGVQL